MDPGSEYTPNLGSINSLGKVDGLFEFEVRDVGECGEVCGGGELGGGCAFEGPLHFRRSVRPQFDRGRHFRQRTLKSTSKMTKNFLGL